jgi:hypothetical protein
MEGTFEASNVEIFNNKVKSRFIVCLNSVGRGLNSRREASPHAHMHACTHTHTYSMKS